MTDSAPRQHPLAQALLGALETHRDAVLQAPTGAGKSTVVPLALLEAFGGDKILMLEPRRLAARAVATRMAATLGEPVGAAVGYRMRLDTRVSSATRIEVLTEAVLSRILQEDPELSGVACVIFDEFHERNLQADLGLALCLDSRRQLQSRFRIVVMSATLEGERVAALLGEAAVVRVPGRQFPVQLHYLGQGPPPLPGPGVPPERPLAQAVRRALEKSDGDVLVFLPGGGEIRRLQRELEQAPLSGVRVLPLYGDLPAAAQDEALAPKRGRKVVLATNIAETSLTIEGVTVVIDSGLVRRSRFDPVTGMSRLDVERISRASSEQRAGRAGRTAPGVCYRLWSEGAQQSLAAFTPPEILDADLAPLALELARWGATDAAALDWLDPPPPAPLQQARELLQRLGALQDTRLTATGRAMAQLPLHPRLSHMLLAAEPNDRALAARLAALLSERDPLRQAGPERDPDLRSRLELLRGAGARGPVLQRVQRSAQALSHLVGATLSERDFDADVGALLALAFPDRIGQRRSGSSGRYLLSNGRGAAFTGAPVLARAEYIVAVELDDREREARIDLAAAIERSTLERLFAERIVEQDQIAWDARAEAVSARRTRRLDALVLEERALPEAPAEATLQALLEGIRSLGLEVLPWDTDTRNLQARLQFVAALQRSELASWPASDDVTLAGTLEQWLAPWLDRITRREQLARVPLAEALLARLTHAQRRALDELAPRELTVPSGSRVRVDYVDDSAPCVSVRLQEVFGLRTTPRIGGGGVPITFKLLSPARRPVQITRDLEGFWKGSYAQVRKDLRGRYPKHAWPENPLSAAPARATKRPR